MAQAVLHNFAAPRQRVIQRQAQGGGLGQRNVRGHAVVLRTIGILVMRDRGHRKRDAACMEIVDDRLEVVRINLGINILQADHGLVRLGMVDAEHVVQ